jgi:hypothetical protein
MSFLLLGCIFLLEVDSTDFRRAAPYHDISRSTEAELGGEQPVPFG